MGRYGGGMYSRHFGNEKKGLNCDQVERLLDVALFSCHIPAVVRR